MSRTLPPALIAVEYAEAAWDYLRSLPPEHFMEATAQATQREITLASLALVKAARPDVHVFNELLVQYPREGGRKPAQVVPDNMVVVSAKPVVADGSFDVPLQPAGPFWVLDYVCRHSPRKDYIHNFDQYEQELKVPYFLLFDADKRDLTLYRHTGARYQAVPPDARGRHPVPELEVEIGQVNGWVRYWHRGELLPLPAEMFRALNEVRRAQESTGRPPPFRIS